MSRAVDRFPAPADSEKRRMKVVVASCNRNGTLGLYEALKMLGYKPYHMAETQRLGTSSPAAMRAHLGVLAEGIKAEKNRFLGIKRYTREDFDRFLGDYDALVEVGSWMGASALDAYLADPDVKFILTERDADRWVASVNGSIGAFVPGMVSFPHSVLKYFNADLWAVTNTVLSFYLSFSDGTYPGQPRNAEALRRNYLEYNQMVKEKVPAERLKVINLEDGLGWKEICPFLGKPIPSEPYPRQNEAAAFKERIGHSMGRRKRDAALKMAAVVLPVLGAGAVLAHRLGLPAAIARAFK